MKRFYRQLQAMVTALLCVLASPGVQAQAQIDPTRPIRIYLGVGPGSVLDFMNRTLAEQLQKQMGNPVIVEFRSGADSILAVSAVANAPADGLSMVPISAGSAIINGMTYSKLPYKMSDLRPLVGMVRVSTVLIASPSKFATLADLLGTARKVPGKLSIGTYAPIYSFGAQMFAQAAGVQLLPVPYKGVGPLNIDILGGNLDTGFVDAGGAAALIQAGKLAGLAVSSKERLAMIPNVPTFREQGYPDFDPQVWIGMAIHAQTPEPIAQRLEAELQAAMQSPAWKALLAKQGSLEPWVVGSKDFAAFIERDSRYFRKMEHLFEKKQ